MSESMRPYDGRERSPYRTGANNPASLADVLERVLDKGVVIAGDIQVRLLDIELLTIKIRLLIASVDKAKEMGINWWESDPFVSTQALGDDDQDGTPVPACSRGTLGRIEDTLTEAGIEASIGHEIEFLLVGPDGGRPTGTAPPGPPAAATPARVPASAAPERAAPRPVAPRPRRSG